MLCLKCAPNKKNCHSVIGKIDLVNNIILMISISMKLHGFVNEFILEIENQTIEVTQTGGFCLFMRLVALLKHNK